jgi:hypothetical protein
MAAPSNAAQDIKDILESDGIGTFGTDLFVDKQPDSGFTLPMIVIYNSPGFPPEATGKNFRQASVQVNVIGSDGGYVAANAKMLAIEDALHQRTVPESVASGNAEVFGILEQGDMGPVDYDELNRPVFTTNFTVWRTYP